jgi:serine protease AprX
LWGKDDPTGFSALFGSTALWGKGTPEAANALWGQSSDSQANSAIETDY